VNPREAIEAAELAEAETAYRHQLARQMYQAGQRAGFQAGYRQADADEAARWAQIARPVARGISHAELEQRRWGLGAAPTSQTGAPATSPAGAPSRKQNPNEKWRPDDRPSPDPGGNHAGRRRLPAVVAVGADSGAHPET
jgi:hypothetical protein